MIKRNSLTFLIAILFVSVSHSDQKEVPPTSSKEDKALATSVEQCRLTQNEQKMVECIEQGLYDPCDYGGGIRSWIYAQCAWGHAEVAERKLQKIEGEIVKRLNAKKHRAIRSKFQTSQRQWRQSTDFYCQFVNDADDSGVFSADAQHLSYGFCLRRFKEQRVKELEPYVSTEPAP